MHRRFNVEIGHERGAVNHSWYAVPVEGKQDGVIDVFLIENRYQPAVGFSRGVPSVVDASVCLTDLMHEVPVGDIVHV